MRYYAYPNQESAYAAMEELQRLDAGTSGYLFNEFRAKSTGEFVLFVPDLEYSDALESYLTGLTPEYHWWEGTIEEARQIKALELYKAIENAITSLTERYSQEERQTFETQESQALAYLESQDPADAPMLEMIATVRGISLQSLAETIVAKGQQLREKRNKLIGLRGRMTDEIAVETDVAKIVDYPYQRMIQEL